VNRTGKDPFQRRLEITNGILLAVLVAGSLLLHSPRFTLGILCGGLISIANFHWLHWNLQTVFARHLQRGRAALMVRYGLRLAVTALVLFWLISGDRVDVIGLVIGLSIIVLNIALTTLMVLTRKKRVEEVR